MSIVTSYFQNGQLVKILPADNCNQYTSRYIISDGQRFEVAPYFGHRSGAVGGGNVIIYDNTNKRFMALDDDNKKIPHVLTFSGGTADFQAETGRDMVYMDWT